ncbi:MAG: PoNe immunity protein domain-containing protein [Cyclobacteriaceae bacterium]
MRDQIKNKAYFQEYISETDRLLDKRKLKFENNLIKPDRIAVVKNDMALEIIRKAIATYSIGKPIEELRPILLSSIKLIEDYWSGTWSIFDEKGKRLNQYGGSIYTKMLSLISITFLLGECSDQLRKIDNTLNKDGVSDLIFEYILSSAIVDKNFSTEESYRIYFHIPEIYSLLRKAILAQDKQSSQLLIKQFLEQEWYQNLKKADAEPAESHKSKHNSYYGYWCFEAATVTCIKGLDDSSYRDHSYYPKDLADYYRANNS